MTQAELLAAGVEPGDAEANAGKWTLTVQGNRGSWGKGDIAELEFQLLGDHIRFQQKNNPSFWDVRWRLEGPTLNFEIVNSDWNTAQAQVSLNAYWGGAWTKVE